MITRFSPALANPFSALTGRRRLVNLGLWPTLQLQLPLLLLATTAAFLLLFTAHTQAAYGSLIDVSFRQAWLQGLAAEIRPDYLVVSAAIGIGYVLFVLGLCLASAHRLLGPIIALERHLLRLRQGDFEARVQVRSGHPLGPLAHDLNELASLLEASRTNDDARDVRS